MPAGQYIQGPGYYNGNFDRAAALECQLLGRCKLESNIKTFRCQNVGPQAWGAIYPGAKTLEAKFIWAHLSGKPYDGKWILEAKIQSCSHQNMGPYTLVAIYPGLRTLETRCRQNSFPEKPDTMKPESWKQKFNGAVGNRSVHMPGG